MAAGETPTLPVAALTSNGEAMCLMHTLLWVIPIILQIISKKFGGMENSLYICGDNYNNKICDDQK